VVAAPCENADCGSKNDGRKNDPKTLAHIGRDTFLRMGPGPNTNLTGMESGRTLHRMDAAATEKD
jgi:hypothetical protein